MKIVFRVLSVLVGLAMFFMALNWHVDPQSAAEGLGLALQSGLGASTQIGDLSALFGSIALMIGWGQRRGEAHWLLGAALVLGLAATMRTLAFLLGHAPFGLQFIGPEFVMAAILVTSARMRAEEGAEASADRG